MYEDKLNKLRKEENKFEVNKKNWLKNQFYQDELFFKGSSLNISPTLNKILTLIETKVRISFVLLNKTF